MAIRAEIEALAFACRTTAVYDLAVKTPLTPLPMLSLRLGASILLKREDLQTTFSFKVRGATHTLAQWIKETRREKVVITASAGNHAQGVAAAARHYGVPVIVVMPETTPEIKVSAVRMLGADVIIHGEGYDEASNFALEKAKLDHLKYIPPFDDRDIIIGQGTVAMEIVDQCQEPPAAVFIPVGGGGLIAGMGAYLKTFSPHTKVIGVQPFGTAALATSLRAKQRVSLSKVDRFADGVAVRSIGEWPWRVAQECVDDVILVSTDEICAAVRAIFEDARAIVEPAGALALAGLQKYAQTRDVEKQTLVAVASGANVNFDRFGAIVERAEFGAGREILLAIPMPADGLLPLCRLLSTHIISEFDYRDDGAFSAQLLVGVRDHGDLEKRAELKAALTAQGLDFYDLSQNEMARQHLKYMIGGRVNSQGYERFYHFSFSERPWALETLIKAITTPWHISLFHYRNHGFGYGQALVGFVIPPEHLTAFQVFMRDLPLTAQDETDNPALARFLRAK